MTDKECVVAIIVLFKTAIVCFFRRAFNRLVNNLNYKICTKRN